MFECEYIEVATRIAKTAGMKTEEVVRAYKMAVQGNPVNAKSLFPHILKK